MGIIRAHYNNNNGGGATTSDSAGTKKITAVNTIKKKSKNVYLKNLPLTDSLMKLSDDKIVEAFYMLGSIYREQLSDNPRAVESFEELSKRYPENKYKLTLYYQLYRLALVMNNEQRAEYYKNILVSQYPETEYAKIIANPDYNKNKQATLNEAERLYQETYQTYIDGDYAGTIAKCNVADTALGKNPLMAKFDLLEALAIGHTQDIKEFEGALTRIIIKYPKDAIKDKAQEYLDMIKKQKQSPDSMVAAKESVIALGVKYLFDKDAEFYWVLVNTGSVDMNKTKIGLSDLNAKYYSLDELATESILLDANKPMVMVKKFKGKEKAMGYYKLVNENPDILKTLSKTAVQTFIISEDNFMLFYKDKDIDSYLSFFQGNFLK